MGWERILKKFNLYWVWQDVLYRLDWRKPNADSVKKFLKSQVLKTKRLKAEGRLPEYSDIDRDEIVIKCLKFVRANLEYESDKARFNVDEKWQAVEETISFLKGDCEDGAILIYSLARANGVSPGQLRLTCGWVIANGRKEGHCWVEYMPDRSFKGGQLGDWYTIDWCYWPDERGFNARDAKNTERYIQDWWSVTDFDY